MAWAALAERTAEYLRKGRKVYVEGRLQTRTWEGQDGQKHYTTELIANTVTALDPRPREDGVAEPVGARPARRDVPGGAAGPEEAPASPAGPGDDFGSSDLDELPF